MKPAKNTQDSLPKVIKPEIKPLTDDSLEQFVQAIKGHPLERLFLIDLFTGMREGELLGLSWDCVDFDNSLILINKQLMHIQVEGVGRVYKLAPTKNSKGRVIAAADSVMRMLLECRQQQEDMVKRAGSDWNNPDNLVFTNEIGGHMTHTTVYNQFKHVMKDIGRPEVRFHDPAPLVCCRRASIGRRYKDGTGNVRSLHRVVHAGRIRTRFRENEASQRGEDGRVYSECFG